MTSWPVDQRYMVLDYETFSEVPLKTAGAAEYARHPSTEILCCAFRIGTRAELAAAPTRLITRGGDGDFAPFFQALMDERVALVAHNAMFEQLVTRHVFAARLMYSKPELQRIPISRWNCTAALVRSIGLPGALAQVGAALALRNRKDDAGHRLMLKLSQPRKPTKKDPSTRHLDPDDLERLYAYCRADIAAEVELFLRLPPLPPRERQFWILDQRINLRGFHVDRDLVKGALNLIEGETATMDAAMHHLSGGRLASARQRDALLAHLSELGLVLPNMQGETVEATLERRDLPPLCRQLLEIRDAVSRSSTAKYQAFEACTRADGRARDNTIFYGAHTGRQAGTRVQPQNLFKRTMPQRDVEVGISLMRAGDFHTIQALFEKPMELYASAIRSCIVAAPGRVLDVGDFATVEVRVLFWLAGHADGLADLAAGRDLYIDMAAEIYALDPVELAGDYASGDGDAGGKRQLGKCTVLGSGFGMGVGGERFQESAKSYGLDISLSLARAAVTAYRGKHPPVPRFWRTIEAAAVAAMHEPGKAFRHGFLTWRREGEALTVELPIGRRLSYFQPRLERKQSLYGERLTLTYMGIDSKTKQFTRQKTWGGKLTENVVQAVARDLLMEAAARLERGASKPVLMVHDEIVGERQAGDKAGLAAFLEAMAEVPPWAPGLPVKVEGWSADRYRK